MHSSLKLLRRFTRFSIKLLKTFSDRYICICPNFPWSILTWFNNSVNNNLLDIVRCGCISLQIFNLFLKVILSLEGTRKLKFLFELFYHHLLCGAPDYQDMKLLLERLLFPLRWACLEPHSRYGPAFHAELPGSLSKACKRTQCW